MCLLRVRAYKCEATRPVYFAVFRRRRRRRRTFMLLLLLLLLLCSHSRTLYSAHLYHLVAGCARIGSEVAK